MQKSRNDAKTQFLPRFKVNTHNTKLYRPKSQNRAKNAFFAL